MATTLAAGAGVVLLIFLLFSYYYDVSSQKLRRQEIDTYLSTIGDSTAWGIDNWLMERIRLAENIGDIIGSADDGVSPDSALHRPVYEKTFLWTYYGDAHGAYHIWPPDETLPADYDPRTRPWYEAARVAGAPTLTEPYLDIMTNTETITVAAPIFRDGALAGVVGADFSTETLGAVLRSTDLGGLGFAFLVSGSGTILAHPDRSLVAQDLKSAFPGLTPSLDGGVQFLDDESSPQIMYFVKVPSLISEQWYVGLAIDRNKAFASLRDFRVSAAVATLAATVLMILVLGAVVLQLLVAPLLKARQAADAASATKSEFLASMSHEIRTPMNGILGMAEVLLNSPLDTRQRDIASIIVSSGSALMTIINDILDFSKLESGKLRLVDRSFNLRQTVHEVASMMQARAMEKDIELVVRYAPNLCEGVVADDARIRQILSNLIGNAVKFTDTGYVLVDVAGERKGDEIALEFSVVDTGIGIETAEIPRMFERFEQADGSHTRRFGGTGLGLAISKNLVELMNGEIGADSAIGTGSRFWVKLSLPVDERVRAMPAVNHQIFDGARVLAVDDNPVNRRVLEELMNGWDMRATVAAGGEEAIEALANSVNDSDRYHVIVMDYQMPKEDGEALTTRIQLDPRFANIPVIMLSSVDVGYPTSPKAKFAAHLAKPVRPSQLMDVLARVLTDNAANGLARTAITMAERKTIDAPPAEGLPDRPVILVAEDNLVNQMVVKSLIPAAEFKVVVAENGERAIELFLAEPPAAILMDLSMPVMDGLDAARHIRRIEAERGLVRTPIIAATAHVLDEDRDRCRLAGMDDFIPKPIRKPALDEILNRWVHDALDWEEAESA